MRVSKVNKNKIMQIIFSLLGTVLVLWQLLIPGYMMTLDMIEGPLALFPNLSGAIYSHTLFEAIYWLIGSLIGTMLDQKVYIFAIFFCLFYLPLRYFPFEVEDKYKYLGSVMFAINPFVLERFLAGQTAVLAGYALTFPFIYYAIRLFRSHNLKNLSDLLVASFIVGVFSFHFFVIISIISGFLFVYIAINYLYNLISNFDLRKLIKAPLRVIGIFAIYLLLHMYWIYPALTSESNVMGVIGDFDKVHTEAFRTNVLGASDAGSLMGALSLYGFWGEREAWATQFGIIAYDKLFIFLPILFLIFYGLHYIYKRERSIGIFMISALLVSAIFSLGAGDSVFKSFNQFLFDNVFFWVGFRDSHKWSGIIALIMSIALVFGVSELTTNLRKFKKEMHINILLAIFALPILVYSSQILFGFNNKIQVVEYPEEWAKVNEMIKGEEKCKAIFLPWNSYYYLSFNKSLLTANPATKYFECKLLVSSDPEFHSIDMKYANSSEYNKLEEILNSDKSVEYKIADIRSLEVQFVIVTSDMLREKRYAELFSSQYMNLVYDSPAIALFRIE
jgi:hypothetical protein